MKIFEPGRKQMETLCCWQLTLLVEGESWGGGDIKSGLSAVGVKKHYWGVCLLAHDWVGRQPRNPCCGSPCERKTHMQWRERGKQSSSRLTHRKNNYFQTQEGLSCKDGLGVSPRATMAGLFFCCFHALPQEAPSKELVLAIARNNLCGRVLEQLTKSPYGKLLSYILGREQWQTSVNHF